MMNRKFRKDPDLNGILADADPTPSEPRWLTKISALVTLLGSSIVCMVLGTSMASAATVTGSGACVTADSSLVGRIFAAPTNGQATDGNGTYSFVGGCNASGNNQLAVTVFGSHGQAVGTGASAFGFNSAAGRFASGFGLEVRATGVGSSAFGYGAEATAINAVAIGGSAATGTGSLAAGDVTRATGDGAVAIGANATRGAQATQSDAIAIGGQASATGARTVSIGLNAAAGSPTATDAVAIGSNAISGAGGLALGAGANAAQSGQGIAEGGLALGTQAATGATSTRAIAIGSGALVSGGSLVDGGTAIGALSSVSASNALALGSGATASHVDAIALGSGAVTTVAVATPSATLLGTTYDFAGAMPSSTVSIGNATSQRTLTNLAAGRLSALSTDAVNGSQLNATNQALATAGAAMAAQADVMTTLGNSVATALGGTSSFDAVTGAVTTSLSVGGVAHGSVQSALNQVNANTSRGFQVSAGGLAESTIAPGDRLDFRNNDGNIVITKDPDSGELAFDLVDDLAFDSLTVGGATTVDGNGVSIDDGAGNVVSLAATGTTVSDGISTSALGASQMTVGGANPVGVDGAAGTITGLTNTTFDPDGVVSGQAATEDQLAQVNALAGAGFNVIDSGGNAANIGPNGQVTFSGDANISVSQTGIDGAGALAFSLNPNLTLERLTMGDITIDDSGISVGPGVQLNDTGLAIAGGPGVTSAGINAGGQVVSNMAAGVAATDGVNLAQLQAVGNAANAGFNVSAQGANASNVSLSSPTGNTVDLRNTDGNLTITKSDDSNDVSFDLANDLTLDSLSVGGATTIDGTGVSVGSNVALGLDGLSIAGGPSVTAAGIDAGGQVITHVAAGVAATDGVNMAQLQAVGNAATAGFNLTAQGANTTNVGVSSPTGNTLDLKNTDGNLIISKADDSNDVTFNLADSLAFDSLTVGGATTIDGTGVSVGSDVKLDSTGLVIAGGPGLTSAGIDAGNQVISNVAAGVGPNDAVTVSQLSSTLDDVRPHYLSINSTGGGNLLGDGASGEDAMALGKDAAAAGDQAVAMGFGAQASQAQGVALGAGAIAGHANSIALGAGSITIVGARPSYQGAYVGQSSSAGEMNIGNRQITGVAAGAAPTDAVNVSQLNAGVNHAVSISNAYTDAQVEAVNTSVDGLSASVDQLGGRVNSVEGEVDNIRGSVSSLGSRVDGVEQTLADIGSVVVFDNRVDGLEHGGSGVLQVSQDGAVVAPDASGANSMAAGSSASSSAANGTAFGNQSIAGGVNSTAAGQGAVAAAANSSAYGQGASASAINSTALGQGANASHANSVALGSGSATTVGAQASYTGAYVGNSSSTGEVNVGGRTISGIAAGSAGTDAVNVNQLSGGLNQAVSSANAYTDSRVEGLRQDNWQMTRGYRGAAASAMAMAGIPQAYLPGKSMVAVGMGGYQGEYGMAVGLSSISEDGRYVYKAQASGNTSRDWGFSVGAGIQW